MKELVIQAINKIKTNIKAIIRRAAVEMIRGICLGLLFSLASCAATQAAGILDSGENDGLSISGSFTPMGTKVVNDMSDSELCLTIIGSWSETSKDLIKRTLDLTEENTRLKIGQPTAVSMPEDAVDYEAAYMGCSEDYNTLSEKYVDELNAKDDEITNLKGRITELENDLFLKKGRITSLQDKLLEQILNNN